MNTHENKTEVYTQNNESPVLSPEYIRNSVLPEEVKKFIIENIQWKNKTEKKCEHHILDFHADCHECNPFLPQQNNGHLESTTPLDPKPPISPKAIEDVKEIIREYKEVTQGGECCNICVNLQSSGECVLKECICHRKPSPSEIVNSIVNKECRCPCHNPDNIDFISCDCGLHENKELEHKRPCDAKEFGFCSDFGKDCPNISHTSTKHVSMVQEKECKHTNIESNMCPDTCKDCGKILTHPSTDWEREFIEKCAQIEHIRWAKWQNYLYSFMTWNNLIGAWTLPHDKKEYWQQQINTPYQQLSESEKESDRREVRSYMPLVSHAVEEARLKGFEEGLVSSESSHTRSYEHGREQGCTEERERARKMIEGILKSAQALANAQNESDNNISLHLKDHLRSLLANLKEK